MITLRLDPQLEKTVNNLAKQMQISRSELVRQSIFAFIEKQEKSSPWELGRDFFGKHASGQNNLSVDRKTLIKEKIKAKR